MELPSTIDRFLLVPNDLATPDPSFFVEASAGIFGLNAAVVETGRELPFAITVAPTGWLEELHGFGWLRNLRAAGEAASVELARKLVEDWIDRNGSGMTGAAWKPEVLADRVSAWLVNAHFLLDAADPRFYAKVMRSLGRQVRKLDAIHHRAPPGEPRLRCLIALLEAVIATGASNRHAERLESELVPKSPGKCWGMAATSAGTPRSHCNCC